MIKIFLAVFFSFSLVQAATIEKASYNLLQNTLELSLVFEGGLKAHHFSLDFDSCQSVNEVKQVAARLIDSGWDDTGTEELRQVVSFDLSNLHDCKPVELTVFSGRRSRATIWIP